VIFFLILSSSFVEFNKQTLPPSSVSTSSGPATPDTTTPLNPKLIAVKIANKYRLLLIWAGKEPGQDEAYVDASDENSVELQKRTGELVQKFKVKYPAQASLQLGLGSDLSYQTLISVMDGAREYLQDIVLVSDEDAMALELGRRPAGAR
jgi:hypothetical protein